VPTYDYECQQCNRTFEVRQRISAAPLTKCQSCGGPVRRLLAAAPFILKGRGWYVTDYPSESRKKAMEAEKKTAPAETAAGATSTPAPSSSPAGSSSDVASGSTATPTATKD
jgi:putative FmdB family regulatory protein